MPDSSLHYELLAIDAIEDSLSRDNHYYYKNVADILESKGNNAGALGYYKKAYISYRSAYSRINQNRILELEKKYDSNRQEAQLAKLRTQKVFLINGVISLALLLVIILLVSYISISKHKKRVEASANMQTTAEDELRRSWLVNELLKSSAGLFPQFMEDVNREAARSRKISKEVFDNLNDTVDNIKALSRQRLSAITKSENFKALNSNIEYLVTLSDFEKIELLLIECDFSSQEIAELLSTTQASVRSVKTRIKEKIMAMEGLPFDPQTTFSIFK
jgi:DNA-binding CsgD family transcriptional regulator